MVAYSFKQQFRKPILAGTKQQTIRAERKRHARLGEQLQLYTGMRTRQCRIIGRAVCSSVVPVTIGISEGWIMGSNGDRVTDPDLLAFFAMRDGFPEWPEMLAFWQREHPGLAVFSGVVIAWQNLTQEPPDA